VVAREKALARVIEADDAAAQHAVTPEIAKRLGQLAAAPDAAFALGPDGSVLWDGAIVGVIAGGQPFAPRVRLLGELGHDAARQRAARRLEAFVAADAGKRLGALRRLEAAVADGQIRGLARGLAYRLIEAGGVIDRAEVQADTRALSPGERRTLRGLGVRIGAFSLYLPALLRPEARALAEQHLQALTGRVPTQPPETVACCIADAISRPRPEVWPHATTRWLVGLATLWPSLADRIMARNRR